MISLFRRHERQRPRALIQFAHLGGTLCGGPLIKLEAYVLELTVQK
jgi:hypothetical protein